MVGSKAIIAQVVPTHIAYLDDIELKMEDELFF